jgi:hypothetical protein
MMNRPERLISFLVVWLTMFSCICVRGQKPYSAGLGMDFLQLKYPGEASGQYGLKPPISLKNEDMETTRSRSFFSLLPNGGRRSGQEDVLYNQPPNLYFIQSGFFCKREWELEKATHIPFRFRLGSLADCNALEGKH